MIDIQPHPPAQFDFPYTGQMVEVVMPVERVDAACRALGAVATKSGYTIYGCSFKKNDICVVFISKVDGIVSKEDQYNIHRHEIAHCNGWPPDHRVP